MSADPVGGREAEMREALEQITQVRSLIQAKEIAVTTLRSSGSAAQNREEVKAGDRFEQVMPYGRDTVRVERRLDDERVAVLRRNGARQVFPVSTLLNERYWRRSPRDEDHEERPPQD